MSVPVVKPLSAEDPLITIRNSLKLPPELEINREYREKAQKICQGTATWILRRPEFESWSRGDKAVLTIRGSPGCGKSFLSTMVIKHLHDCKEERMAIGHYYFHDNEAKRSVNNALCAMVYQIAGQNVQFAQRAARMCRQLEKSLAATLSSTWYDFFHETPDFNAEAHTCLIFDGIDEAAQEDIKELVKQLTDSLASSTNIKVLLIGRPETQAITSALDCFSAGNIDVSSTLNSHDISLFVDHSYKKYLSHHKVKGLRKTVTNSLREKSNGMFLWVDLVCQELAKIKMITVLKQHLDAMPTGLFELYRNIFQRMAGMVPNQNHAAQLQELFCCLSQSTEPPSVSILNQIIRYATSDPEFYVESVIEKYCASLLVCEETGELLFQSKITSESREKDDRSSVGTICDSDGSASEEEDDSESDFLDEDAADREVEARQRETKVKVRHASVSDFLDNKELQTSSILLNRVDAAFHMVELSLGIILEGASPEPTISESLWLYAMNNFLNQLRFLETGVISPQRIEFLIEKLWKIFNSELLARFISRHHATEEGYPLHDSFAFGFNTDLENINRQAIQKWIKKAHDSRIHMKPATRQWVENMIQSPLQLLVPLTKTCIHEWLCSDETPFILYWRYRFAWLCLVSVS
jgi:ABC-type dipeptide/oligopeptide/nickel transport system ATPase component